MKHLTLILVTALATQSAFAANYLCSDKNGNQSQLTTLANHRILWSEPWHSAQSSGEFKGFEKAPFSEFKGYSLFQLSDFYNTEDSAYMIALGRKGKTRTAIVYFDHDDHIEEETIYNCELVKN